jgi:hypothetical protein
MDMILRNESVALALQENIKFGGSYVFEAFIERRLIPGAIVLHANYIETFCFTEVFDKIMAVSGKVEKCRGYVDLRLTHGISEK